MQSLEFGVPPQEGFAGLLKSCSVIAWCYAGAMQSFVLKDPGSVSEVQVQGVRGDCCYCCRTNVRQTRCG